MKLIELNILMLDEHCNDRLSVASYCRQVNLMTGHTVRATHCETPSISKFDISIFDKKISISQRSVKNQQILMKFGSITTNRLNFMSAEFCGNT